MTYTDMELRSASMFTLVEPDQPTMWVGGNIDPAIFRQVAQRQGHPEQILIPVGFTALKEVIDLTDPDH